MKKYLFLATLLCCIIAAKAANYYVGTYPIMEMIDKMDVNEGPLGDIAWQWKSGEDPILHLTPNSYEAMQFLTNTALGIYNTADIPSNGSVLSWATCNCGSYSLLRGIDWTDKNYLQQSGSNNDIVLEHLSEQYRDLSMVEFLKLSGNRFRNITIVGNGGMTSLKEIDLSNNSTLDYFKISGAPNLQTLKVNAETVEISDITLLFHKLADIQATSLNYVPTGTINLTFPVNAVDLSAEYAISTTFNWISETPVLSENGVFTFADNLVGTTVIVELTNATYSNYGTIAATVTLVDGDYRISTPEQLDDVRNHLGGKFTLEADIDLTQYIADTYGDEGWLPIGDGTTTSFRGTFDGNGHVISGLWINRPTTPYIGLFGGVGYYRYQNNGDGAGATNGPNTTNTTATFGATIKDLGIIADTIRGGDYNVGGLAGAIGNSIITGVYVKADIIGNENSYNVGVLAGSFWGRNNTTLMQDCYSTGSVIGKRSIGGLIGSAFQNDVTININRVYSTADVRLNTGYYRSSVGGVIGQYQSPSGLVKIDSSFAINDTIIGEQAKGDGRTGRFLGGFMENLNSNTRIFETNVYGLKTTKIRLYNHTGDYKNVYYEIDPQDTIISYQGSTTSLTMYNQRQAINKTASQLIQQNTYTDCSWDFDDVWTMGNENYPLPILKKITASAQPTEYPEHLKFDVTVTTSADGGGSISTHTGVEAGDDITITVTPDLGYEVDVFTVNGEEKQAELINNEFTFNCIKEDIIVHVTFRITMPVFTGTGAWTDTGNWNTNAVPASNEDVIIDGDVTINSEIQIAGLVVSAGKSLTFAEGGQLNGVSNAPIGGTIQVIKNFDTDKWYPIGFPFEIESIRIKQNGNVHTGDIYGLDTGDNVTNAPDNINDATTENIYLASYDGAADKFKFAGTLDVNTGYVISVPSGTFQGGEIEEGSVEITFTAASDVTLNSTVSTFTVADGYVLTANPNLVNTTALSGANYYYEYDLTNQRFSLIAGGASLDETLKPFESLVTYKGGDTGDALRNALNIGADDNVALPIVTKDPAVETQYYNLQGMKIAQPQRNQIYLIKSIYRSGAVSVSKSIIR
jgi:hypothetical protein